MAIASVLPALPQSDVQQAANLIQETYSPKPGLSSEMQKRLQQQLFDIQTRPEAWGLVIPFLESDNPNVQFFGAHTAQVKITRDWDAFPSDNATQLRDLLLELTAHAIAVGRSKVILRKLFVALTSLALRLTPMRPSQWPEWLHDCLSLFSSRGLPTEAILDFLAIAVEEVDTAQLLGSSKAIMMQSTLSQASTVVQAITTCITRRNETQRLSELVSALKCLEAWIPVLPSSELTPLIPLLIGLLDPVNASTSTDVEFDESTFVPASDALQEIMSKSALSDGAGTASLTEPLLIWLEAWGGRIVEQTMRLSFVDGVSHSLCKLLVALGDHSTSYFASNIASAAPASPNPPSFAPLSAVPTKSNLVQTFLRLLLSYTGMPGYYGADEDESEMTLGFWYLFQEALWSSDFDGEEEQPVDDEREKQVWVISKAVYSELVQVLKRKVMWPPPSGVRWPKDQVDKFQVYRRDIGDTLINAYYILRDSMLEFYVSRILEVFRTRTDPNQWEELEALLHCVMSVQEAVPVELNVHLQQVFGPDILGQLPTTGTHRIRRTALSLIGTYASWFTTEQKDGASSSSPLLLNTVSYAVSALREPSLCLSAANSLRDLCDINRSALAPHVGEFAELHSNLVDVPDTERSKVLQSIASVVQALPPAEQIPPIEAIVSPVVQKLGQALRMSSQLPDEARALAIGQLQTLAGVAKGLTRTTDPLVLFSSEPEEEKSETDHMKLVRNDRRIVHLRETVYSAAQSAVELWCTDAGVSDALKDLFKAVTAMPSDTTLLSLSADPLLDLVCVAAQRQLTAVWLSLASMLYVQLDPPLPFTGSLKTGPSDEAHATVERTFPPLLQSSLYRMGQAGAMEENPDVVQEFFSCMDNLAQHFTIAFYKLPPGMFDALMQCACTALSLQERYSLVSACGFLATLINRTASSDTLSDYKSLLVQAHGRPLLRAVLVGLAGVAPRSGTLNLIELLSAFLAKWPSEGRAWMGEILFSDDFVPSRAGPDAKERFLKAVVGSRSPKRTREAAQQFILVARGLEGTNFGYAST